MGVVATRFDSTLNVENVPGEELFKIWNKTMLMNKYYKQTWGDLIENLTVAQKNEPGKFKEIHTRFYNKICMPHRDV